ncbi:MAG: hypothetical protein B0W54_08830 [Cellvibrio sp. 79]|nr:MAG: hypothetical protein B0W54_08830 [Cellvibrio sp. 79]
MNTWLLSTVNVGMLLAGLVVVIIGSLLFYRIWQRPERSQPLASLGWGALLLIHWPLGLALGFDRGWAIAAILPGFIALLWIGMTTPWQQRNKQHKQKLTTEPRSIINPAITTSPRFNQTGQL